MTHGLALVRTPSKVPDVRLFEQETKPSLPRTCWFQEQIRALFIFKKQLLLQCNLNK